MDSTFDTSSDDTSITHRVLNFTGWAVITVGAEEIISEELPH
jgi:hypothetical protein